MKKFFIFLCFAVICASLFTGSVYASESWPDFPKKDEGTINIIVKKSNDSSYTYTLYQVRTSSAVETVVLTAGGSLVVKSNGTGDWFYWSMNDGDTSWSGANVVRGNFSAGQDSTITSNVTEIVYSNVNIYSAETGEPVFQLPPEPETPTPTLAEVIQMGVTELQTKTVGTMKILAVCGVGCLSLLIGLVLLPKILFRFL